MAAGSGTVYINGKPAGRVGDAISCGENAAAGASTMSMGD
ncbi:PAAR domain-containing protein [Loktanella sp. F6476L]|nr:PAAR domain-containing protein [Loktanella sp. F6476L]